MEPERRRPLRPATAVVHLGRRVDPETGAVVPPIHLATTFARSPDGELVSEFLYGRYQNPNRRDLEEALARLENGAACACFASGSAAANAIMQSLESGDQILVGSDFYFGIRKWMEALGARTQIGVQAHDLQDLEGVAEVLRRGRFRIVYCETPSNPLMRESDIRALSALAKAAGAVLVVDNTLATPLFQRPLELGADLVLHSTTKALAGHSDVTGGALITNDETSVLWARIQETQRLAGAVPSPFDCWMTLRGLSTLALRQYAASSNAAILAARLCKKEPVQAVLYPGLGGPEVAALHSRQMSGGGSMLSVLLAGGEAAARRFVGALRLFLLATSLGSVHSLAEHRKFVEGPASKTPENLVRLSIGIEDVEDLWEDLDQALAIAQT